MSDDWRRVPIRDLVLQKTHSERVVAGRQYRLLGVRWYGAGAFVRETVSSETSKATRLFPVEAGDFIYNRLFAWKGSFAVVGNDLAGSFVSGEFPLFRADEALVDVRFLLLLMNRTVVWSRIEEESTGSTAVSRNRWKEERFLDTEFLIPPLEQQRRIVDLLASVDNHADKLRRTIDATWSCRGALLSDLVSRSSGLEVALSEVLESQIGGVWGDDPGVGEVDVAVYRQTEFNGDGRLSTPAGAVRSVSKAQLESRELRAGDVLLQKSAGTPTLPGRVVHVPRLHERAIFSNFLTRLRADESKVSNRYLFLLLQQLHTAGAALEHQRGTNIRNLDLTAYLKTRVVVPPLHEQQNTSALIDSMDEFLLALRLQLKTSSTAREGLLSVLLSGDDEIPAAYDEFLVTT